MKLTEKQIASIYQNQTKNRQLVNACEATQQPEGSSSRLQSADHLVSDYSSAQLFKLSFGLKKWTQMLASDVNTQNKKARLFDFFFKPALATSILACAVWVQIISHNNPSSIQANRAEIVVAHDIINQQSMDYSDQINLDSFDVKQIPSDQVFKAPFS